MHTCEQELVDLRQQAGPESEALAIRNYSEKKGDQGNEMQPARQKRAEEELPPAVAVAAGGQAGRLPLPAPPVQAGEAEGSSVSQQAATVC